MPALEVLPPLPALPAGPLPPGAEALRAKVSEMQVRILGIEILTEEDHQRACDLERQLDARLKENEAITQPAVTAANATADAARVVREYFCGPLRAGKQLLKKKIGGFRAERDRLAAEEARQRQLAAMRQEEEERMARAEVLAAQGREEAALALLAQEPEPAAIVPQAPKLQSFGVVTQTRWSAEVVSLDLLIPWVAADLPSRRHYLAAVGPALNRRAVDVKAVDLGIPGVRGVSKNV